VTTPPLCVPATLRLRVPAVPACRACPQCLRAVPVCACAPLLAYTSPNF